MIGCDAARAHPCVCVCACVRAAPRSSALATRASSDYDSDEDSAELDDEIVEEFDVYLSGKHPAGLTVLQCPSQPRARPLDIAACSAVKVKPNQHKLRFVRAAAALCRLR